jgi:phosphoglycolate phosphatase-like HAD superfamily hydrolase
MVHDGLKEHDAGGVAPVCQGARCASADRSRRNIGRPGSRAFPGVRDALARLHERGWRLGVVTNGRWTTKSASCAAQASWHYWTVGASRKR